MKKIFTLMVLLVASLSMQAQTTWTVAGTIDVFGTSWDPTDTNNDMTLKSGVTYELIKTDVILEKDRNYELKVVQNHKWGTEYPASNYKFSVTETAKYKVTITFNESTHEISVVTLKTGEAVVGDKIWTVAGESALMGSDWSVTDTNNDMTKQDDGSYKLVKYNVALAADTEYQYKIVANHDTNWAESYGNNGGGENAFISVDTAGNYDITFTFNPNTNPKTVKAKAAVATGISDVKTDAANSKVTPIYNLNGQRVSGSSRGVIIQNGKKVLK